VASAGFGAPRAPFSRLPTGTRLSTESLDRWLGLGRLGMRFCLARARLLRASPDRAFLRLAALPRGGCRARDFGLVFGLIRSALAAPCGRTAAWRRRSPSLRLAAVLPRRNCSP